MIGLIPRKIAVLMFALFATDAFGQSLDTDKLQREIKAGDVLVDQWIGCSKDAADKLAARSAETADIVAVAVFGACSDRQEKFLQHLLRTHMTVQQADDLIAKIRIKMREQIIAQIVSLRAK